MTSPKLFSIAVLSLVAVLLNSKSFAQEVPKAVQAYQQAWLEANTKDRLNIIKSFWTDESVYEDPSVHAKGIIAFKAAIDKFWQDFPGASFETGTVLSQGNFHTWNWSMFDKNKNLLLKGMDVAEVNSKGQMLHLVGFWAPQK